MDPNTDFERLAVYDIILQFSSLAVFPIICIYIKNCYDDNEVTWVPYLATIPALLLLVLSVIFTSLLGLPRAASLIQLIQSGVVVKSLLTPLDNAYILFNFQIYFVVFYLSLSISLVYVFAKLFTGKFKFKHIAAFLRGEKASFIANVVCLFFVIFFILWGVSVLFSSVFCDTL